MIVVTGIDLLDEVNLRFNFGKRACSKFLIVLLCILESLLFLDDTHLFIYISVIVYWIFVMTFLIINIMLLLKCIATCKVINVI